MSNPWSRAGRVVLVEDVTRSDRAKLPPVQPDGGMIVVTMLIATIWGAVLGFIAALLVLVA